jgi:hypothetical protein
MALYLPATLGPLAKLCPSDNGRYSMAGVRVHDPGNGTFRCEVTDGRVLLIARGQCPQDDETPGNFPAVIPAALWRDIYAEKVINRRTGIPLPVRVQAGLAATTSDEGPCSLEVGDVVRRGRTVSGRYPDVNQVLPKGKPVFTIKVNPEYLADLLSVLSRMLAEDNQGVTLAFWKPDVPMAIVAKDSKSGVCFDALLMPLTEPPAPARYTPPAPAKAAGPEQTDEEPEAEARAA